MSGAFVGLNNTLTTQAVMLVAPVEKPVASAAYGFVRFIGRRPWPCIVAGKLAADCNVARALLTSVPFITVSAAARIRKGIGVVATGHSLLDRKAEHRGEQAAGRARDGRAAGRARP